MTDNGSGYVSKVFTGACTQLRLRHLRTRPYTPWANGKAERLIQSLLCEWAYAQPYASSARRTAALRPGMRYYSEHRTHGKLTSLPPISRLRSAASTTSLDSTPSRRISKQFSHRLETGPPRLGFGPLTLSQGWTSVANPLEATI